jgi:hypothetical protein
MHNYKYEVRLLVRKRTEGRRRRRKGRRRKTGAGRGENGGHKGDGEIRC